MIVCLGWGSLIWHPNNLPVSGPWRNDGPELPVEYVRQSNNGRLTLVLDDQSIPLQVYWAPLNVSRLDHAVDRLREREGCIARRIGRWPGDELYPHSAKIQAWAEPKGIKGVVWTALGPKFDNTQDRRPSQTEALVYLRSLDIEASKLAEEYVRKTPTQITTEYRKAFELGLGWTPLG